MRVNDDIGDLAELLARGVTRRARGECGTEVTPITFIPVSLSGKGDVQNDRVYPGVRKEHHRVGRVELMRSEDRLAVAFDRMDELVLPRAHVTPHVVKRNHRALNDRAKANDRAGARKHFQRRKRSVSRAKAENKLIGCN